MSDSEMPATFMQLLTEHEGTAKKTSPIIQEQVALIRIHSRDSPRAAIGRRRAERLRATFPRLRSFSEYPRLNPALPGLHTLSLFPCALMPENAMLPGECRC